MRQLYIFGLFATLATAMGSESSLVEAIDFTGIETRQSDEEASTTVFYRNDGTVDVMASHGRGYKLGSYESGTYQVTSPQEYQSFVNEVVSLAKTTGSPVSPNDSKDDHAKKQRIFDMTSYTKVDLPSGTFWIAGSFGRLGLNPLKTKASGGGQKSKYQARFISNERYRKLITETQLNSLGLKTSQALKPAEPLSAADVKNLVAILEAGADWNANEALEWANHLKVADREALKPLLKIKRFEPRVKALLKATAK
jgi:hypothetical protein